MTAMADRSRTHLRFAPLAEAGERFVAFVGSRLAPVLDLVVRLWLAQAFFRSGVLKIATWEATVFLYTQEHPVPGVAPGTAALLGTGIELVCPVLLVLGLFTRIAAVPLLLTTALLQFTYKPLDFHLLAMALLGLLIVRGPLALSLDHLLAPHLRGSAVPFGGALHRLATMLSGVAAPVTLAAVRLWLAYVCAGPEVARLAAGDVTAAGYAEAGIVVIAGALFAAGMFTRAAALPLLVLALFRLGSEAEGETAILQVLLLATFVLEGGGALAVDFLLHREFQRLFPSLAGDRTWLADAPRVVIVGAGFGGIAAAQKLRHAWARVTLVDRRNYHLFQPLLYQVATATLSPANIATPVRGLLRDQGNCQVIMGRVTGVDTTAREVAVGERRIAYDYLVLATGARHSYFGKDEWEPFAPGLKKIDDATAIRGRILTAFERAETTDDAVERQRQLAFVIVGGGPTGVELAGAIVELARHGLAGEFRAADPSTARVILVQSAPRVLPAMPERLSAAALASLQKLGVEVRLNSRVEQVDARGVLVSGERIEAATVLWAAGVIASPAGKWIGTTRDNAGRVVVGGDLTVPGLANVFAIGDTATCPDGNGQTLPGLAAVAKQQGWHVAKVIRAAIEGRPHPGAFRYIDLGSMATIGRKAAVAALPGVKISGTLAWWLWGAVHVALLVDVRSRIAVLFDWFWSYLTYNRSIRLITGAEAGAD
jgi:NADH dehydrogenase/putative oxidoreductase